MSDNFKALVAKLMANNIDFLLDREEVVKGIGHITSKILLKGDNSSYFWSVWEATPKRYIFYDYDKVKLTTTGISEAGKYSELEFYTKSETFLEDIVNIIIEEENL